MAEEQPKNSLLEYREKAIQLMDFLFGERVNPDSPGVKYKNYTNTKIEEILSSNRSQISRLLKDPNLIEKQPLSEEAIKIIIIKLVRVLDLKELGSAAIKENTRLKKKMTISQQQIETLKQEIEKRPKQTDIDKVTGENTTLKEAKEKLKKKITHYKRWMYVGTVLTIFIAWFCSGVFLVQNKTTMNNVAEWHGENIINQIVLEGLELNRRVKEGEVTLKNKSDTLKEEKKLIGEISAIIKTGRVRLDAIGFFMPNGDKMGKCINRFIHYKDQEGNLTLDNSIIEDAVKEIILDLLNPHIRTSTLKGDIRRKVLLKQQSLWEEMEACLRPFSRPRPLKTPSKD